MQHTTSNLAKVSELLSDSAYHDDTSMSDKLDITRAAIWDAIKQLIEYGIDIKSVKGRGYRMVEPLILLSDTKIQAHLKKKTRQMAQIDILEKTESTNDYLMEHVTHNKKISIGIAEMQTQGRGRLNRQWHSPFGRNIYFSMRYPFQKDINELSGLSLVIGLAVSRAIASTTQLENIFFVKWPNDVVANLQKVAGILIDIQAEPNGYCQAIIGIGINVNMHTASQKEIHQAWTSLQKLTTVYLDRNILCSILINTVTDYLERFSKSGLSDFIDEWKQKDCLFNQSVQLLSGNVKFGGIGAGINSQGHLLLKMPDQTTRSFSSGDTTLLK